MKQLLYILCIALLLASCRKNEPTGETFSGQELTFNLSIDEMPTVETRAAGDDSDLKTYGFYLAGYHTYGLMNAASAKAYPNVFNYDAADGQAAVPLVSFANNKFTLKTIKWKLDNTSYLSFYGWSQNKKMGTTSATGIIGQTADINDKGYPWIDIRNADAPSDQTDIVGSRSENHKNDAVISAVDLDFGHLLSKLSFKAKSSSKASFTVTAVTVKYAPNKVFKKARYTFGSDTASMGNYGAYTEYQSGNVALNSSYPQITNGAEVSLGSLLLIPQSLAAGNLSLEIKYKNTSSSSSTTVPEQTRTLPLSALSFEQGKNYLYTLDIRANEIVIKPDPLIEPWKVINTALPLISGPKGNTLLLLDGYDRPYRHTDGKDYWLDRSGYNRHAELREGYISYDNDKHSYVFNGNGAIIPALEGSSSSYTFDMVAENAGNLSGQFPFIIGNFVFQMTVSDYGTYFLFHRPRETLSWHAPKAGIVDKQSFWSIIYGDQKVQMYHNALLKAQTKTTTSSTSTGISFLAAPFDGRISYVKVSNVVRTRQEITDDYFEQKERYNIIQNELPQVDGPKGDVKLLLDGRDGPYIHSDGKKYWLDKSGYNNHMLLTNVKSDTPATVSYNSVSKCYEFNFNAGKQGSTLPMLCFADATVEICSQRTQSETGTCPMSLSGVGTLDNSVLRLLTGVGKYPATLHIYSGGNYVKGEGSFQIENLKNVMNKQLWTVVSSNSPNTITAYQNGTLLETQRMTNLNRLTSHKTISCDVSGFNGNIHYIRITSKAKTASEVLDGNKEIKAIFNY